MSQRVFRVVVIRVIVVACLSSWFVCRCGLVVSPGVFSCFVKLRFTFVVVVVVRLSLWFVCCGGSFVWQGLLWLLLPRKNEQKCFEMTHPCKGWNPAAAKRHLHP